MLEALGQIIIDFISLFGYPAIFFLMTVESALIPVPSEVTMPFAGFLVGLGKLDFWLVVLMGGLGNLAGSILAYFLGYWGQETVVRRLVKNYGKYFLISQDEVNQAEQWFRRHGGKIAFFSRLLPVVRTYISLPAGVAKMNVFKFSVYTLVGSLIWSTFLTYLGVILGQNWQILEVYFQKFDIFIITAGVVLVSLYVYHKIQRIKKTT